MTATDNITYCQGRNCALRSTCRRFISAPAVFEDIQWMRNCEETTRNGYIKL
ncbi:MAG: hypothetical protein IJ588_13695 [Prevotella sp.]|nr:hypothetical protein [Prevotella sp.]